MIFTQLAFGTGIISVCVIFHVFILVRLAKSFSTRFGGANNPPSLNKLFQLLVFTTMVLVCMHAFEAWVWAMIYYFLGEFENIVPERVDAPAVPIWIGIPVGDDLADVVGVVVVEHVHATGIGITFRDLEQHSVGGFGAIGRLDVDRRGPGLSSIVAAQGDNVLAPLPFSTRARGHGAQPRPVVGLDNVGLVAV